MDDGSQEEASSNSVTASCREVVAHGSPGSVFQLPLVYMTMNLGVMVPELRTTTRSPIRICPFHQKTEVTGGR